MVVKDTWSKTWHFQWKNQFTFEVISSIPWQNKKVATILVVSFYYFFYWVLYLFWFLYFYYVSMYLCIYVSMYLCIYVSISSAEVRLRVNRCSSPSCPWFLSGCTWVEVVRKSSSSSREVVVPCDKHWEFPFQEKIPSVFSVVGLFGIEVLRELVLFALCIRHEIPDASGICRGECLSLRKRIRSSEPGGYADSPWPNIPNQNRRYSVEARSDGVRNFACGLFPFECESRTASSRICTCGKEYPSIGSRESSKYTGSTEFAQDVDDDTEPVEKFRPWLHLTISSRAEGFPT